jgi:hypothetical protein
MEFALVNPATVSLPEGAGSLCIGRSMLIEELIVATTGKWDSSGTFRTKVTSLSGGEADEEVLRWIYLR